MRHSVDLERTEIRIHQSAIWLDLGVDSFYTYDNDTKEFTIVPSRFRSIILQNIEVKSIDKKYRRFGLRSTNLNILSVYPDPDPPDDEETINLISQVKGGTSPCYGVDRRLLKSLSLGSDDLIFKVIDEMSDESTLKPFCSRQSLSINTTKANKYMCPIHFVF